MTVDRTVVASRRLWELFETLHDVMYFIEFSDRLRPVVDDELRRSVTCMFGTSREVTPLLRTGRTRAGIGLTGPCGGLA